MLACIRLLQTFPCSILDIALPSFTFLHVYSDLFLPLITLPLFKLKSDFAGILQGLTFPNPDAAFHTDAIPSRVTRHPCFLWK